MEQQIPSPPTTQDLWAVWGAAPNDLWAVGGNGRSEGQATIYRYDGTTWTPLAVPLLERANVWAFFKVWGTAADDVWIVGQRGIILQWNGAELVEHDAGTGDDLISVWGNGVAQHVALSDARNEWGLDAPAERDPRGRAARNDAHDRLRFAATLSTRSARASASARRPRSCSSRT